MLIKKPHIPDTPITEFISQYIPNVEPENEIGDTLTYKINSEHRPRLQKMLIHLENERKSMGIENIRVVGSELSDIYMKLVTSFRLRQQVIPDVSKLKLIIIVSPCTSIGTIMCIIDSANLQICRRIKETTASPANARHVLQENDTLGAQRVAHHYDLCVPYFDCACHTNGLGIECAINAHKCHTAGL